MQHRNGVKKCILTIKGVLNFPEGVGCVERDNLQFDKIGPPYQNPATLGVSCLHGK